MLAMCNTVRLFLGERLRPLVKQEQGVTIVEYAIMLALIAIAVALATPNIKAAVVALFGQAVTVMNGG
jgi:Flp pilus assembly pilin Flp